MNATLHRWEAAGLPHRDDARRMLNSSDDEWARTNDRVLSAALARVELAEASEAAKRRRLVIVEEQREAALVALTRLRAMVSDLRDVAAAGDNGPTVSDCDDMLAVIAEAIRAGTMPLSGVL